jgi:hypothetical protein
MADTTQVPKSLEEQMQSIQAQFGSLTNKFNEGVTNNTGQVVLPAGSLKDVPGFTLNPSPVSQTYNSAIGNIGMNSASAVASATSQDEFIKAQQAQYQAQQAELEKARKSNTDLASQQNTLIANRQSSTDATAAKLAEYNVPENWNEIQGLIPSINTLNSQLATLQAKRDTELNNIEMNPQFSAQYASRESTRVKREYSIQESALSAEIGVKTALMQALQNNITQARGMVSDIVKAMNYDTDQKMADINTFMDNNQNFINSLTSSQQSILTDISNYWKDKATQDDKDYTDKLKMVVDAANKGVNLNISASNLKTMPIGELTNIYGQKVSQQTEKTTGFTQSQNNSGASNAGLGINEFSNLPLDVKNAYVQNNKFADGTSFSDWSNAIFNADNASAVKAIDGAPIPQAVKDWMKTKIKPVDTSTQQTSFWNKLKNIFTKVITTRTYGK